MRKKLALLLALCMVAGTIGSPSGIQEIWAAEVQETGKTADVETEHIADKVTVETEVIKCDSGDFEYVESKWGTVTITKYKGSAMECVIPSAIDGIKVDSIDPNAFSECDNLCSVTIPYSISSMKEEDFESEYRACALFKSCSSLKEIIVDSGNASYSSQDGVLYNKTKTQLICCPVGKEGSVAIPEGVTSIEWASFRDCYNITSVTIPNSVSGEPSLDANFFQGCSALEEIIVDNNNEKYSSLDGILYNKNKTNLICCPESKTGVVEISAGVTEIGKKADVFSTYVPAKVFINCTKITGFLVDDNNPVFSSQDGILYKKGETEILRCPGGAEGVVEIPGEVTSIEAYAFSNCQGMTGMKIPETVTSIGEYAFSGCEGLTELSLPSEITKLESNIFNGCTGLKEIKIPETVTSIGEYAFNGCSGLSSIILPGGIAVLTEGLFKDCTGLKSIEIQDGVTRIEPYAFSGCSSLGSITLPEGVTQIDYSAFENCSSLTSVNIPNTVAGISWGSVFENCNSLTNISIDQEHGAYSMVDGAVYDKDGITLLFCLGGQESFRIPAVVTNIKSDAFSICNSLEEIIVDEDNEKYSSLDGMLCGPSDDEDNEGLYVLYYPSGKKESVITLKDIGVERGVFRNRNNLQKVILNRVSLHAKTFVDCDNLQEVIIEGGTIFTNAFYNCSNLQKVTLRCSLYEGAFANCDNIQEVVIKGGLIRENIFQNFDSIKKVRIENTTIRSGIFGSCDNLEEVIILGGRILGNAFNKCKNLGSVILLDLEENEDTEIVNAPAFIGCGAGLHIYCEKDSVGEEYAIANNIPYTIITRKEQTITASDITKTIGDEPFPIGATTDGDGELSYSCYSDDEVVAISEDGIITVIGEGTAEIRITAAATVACVSATKTIIVTVTSGQTGTEKKTQTITASDITATDGDVPFTIGAETNGNGKLSYESSDESVAAVTSDGAITIKGVGTAQITITAAETDGWKAAQKIITITVNPKQPGDSQKPEDTQKPEDSQQPEETEKPENSQKPEDTQKPEDSESSGEDRLTQTITAKDIKKTYGEKPFSLNAKASGGGKLSYSVENNKVARIDKNGKVTITGCGVTEIEIYAEATGAYDEAEETITLTVAPKKLTITSAKSQKSKSITVKWKKDTKASGYIIEYSTDKKFRKSVKTVAVAKNKTTSKKILKLKTGKKYYIRACAYTLADGRKIKGAYTTVKKAVKVK